MTRLLVDAEVVAGPLVPDDDEAVLEFVEHFVGGQPFGAAIVMRRDRALGRLMLLRVALPDGRVAEACLTGVHYRMSQMGA